MTYSKTASVFLLAQLLAACGNGGGEPGVGATIGPSGVPAVPPPPQTQTLTWIGHYVGTVKIAGVSYFADAVLTQDGLVRLYVGGPGDNTGAIQMTRPASSVQFVGAIEMRAAQGSGSGAIIGEECAINAAGPYCGDPAAAKISATLESNSDGATTGLQGEIDVTAATGTESWQIDLGLWSDNEVAAIPWKGQLKEVLAEFASADDVIMNSDNKGMLTFQSASSGCVGNGALVPHLDGSADIYDVSLTIENCGGPYAYLNGQYDGLALYTSSTYWDYDGLLRMWLSKPQGMTPPAALTTLGEPLQ
jgi:hypothetical protein